MPDEPMGDHRDDAGEGGDQEVRVQGHGESSLPNRRGCNHDAVLASREIRGRKTRRAEDRLLRCYRRCRSEPRSGSCAPNGYEWLGAWGLEAGLEAPLCSPAASHFALMLEIHCG